MLAVSGQQLATRGKHLWQALFIKDVGACKRASLLPALGHDREAALLQPDGVEHAIYERLALE